MRRACLALACGAVAGLSLTPASSFKRFDLLAETCDKLMHVAMYGLLAVTAGWAFPETVGRRTTTIVATALVVAGYGLLLEVMQGCLTSLQRSFSFGDAAANSVGAVVGLWLWVRACPAGGSRLR